MREAKARSLCWAELTANWLKDKPDMVRLTGSPSTNDEFVTDAAS